MRAVVVLPLLPVMTIFLALLAPTTDFSISGSMRLATKPGKLVPPPIRKKRPDAPASFPAEIARLRRALSRPDGVAILPLEACMSSLTIYLHSFPSFYGMQYNKRVDWEQVAWNL